MGAPPISSSTTSKLNHSARFKAMMPEKLPIRRSSPYLTIPPGFSPRTLLDSPVLFCSGQVCR